LTVTGIVSEDETTEGSLLNDVIRAVAMQRRRHEEVDWDEVSRAGAERSGAIVRIAHSLRGQ